MASNPYVNKVQKADGTVLIDISSDTVAAGSMLNGVTAHDKSGAPVTGNIATKTSSDMTASGKTVTAPAGYYASAQSKDVADGTVTNNTTLPSGSSSSGTLNRGSYLKIGEGYHTEKYYKGQENSGTKTITESGITSVDGYANVDVPKGAIVISVSATSNTTKTISNSAITEDHYVYNLNSADIGSDMTWITRAGSITLSCSSGIPAMNLMLCREL